MAGFAPALFMLSTWPHIPRWYAYGFPAVYILAAAAAVRLAAHRPPPAALEVKHAASRQASPEMRFSSAARRVAPVGVAVLVLLPAIVLANLDLFGATKLMELLLFQPTHWSYLWSR